MTARLIAEWMSFVGRLHTAVRKDSRALALFADAEDLADEGWRRHYSQAETA
jgi:hypothetical protein